jgi:O-antigen/teichoic acid export membrane protein
MAYAKPVVCSEGASYEPDWMSRRRNALVATAFTYVQWVLAILTGLFLTRFLVGSLGQQLYGTWLATGTLLAYASLADLGILGVMPWLFAEAEGALDTVLLRRLFAHGLAVSVAGAAVYLAFALCLWQALPSLLHLSGAERETLHGPVLVLIVLTALGYPLRLALAYRQGLQDYSFLGVLGLLQGLLNVALVVGFTWAGAPLFGVAIGASLPGFLSGVAAAARTFVSDRHVFFASPKLDWATFKSLLTSGGGQWLGSLGWQLAFASDAVIIGYLGSRELVPVFAITSRLGLTLMQLSWTLPDSTLVGLAQMKAQDGLMRVGGVVLGLLRFHLLAAGFVGCAILAGNGTFVSVWVGSALFGGPALNALFAVAVLTLSVAHALVTPIAVLGRRMTIGLLTVANGILHILLALVLGKIWGLPGIALATTVSAVLSTLPVGFRLLSTMLRSLRLEFWNSVFVPWLVRGLPCLILAFLAGLAVPHVEGVLGSSRIAHLVAAIGAGGVSAMVYLFAMRPLTRILPLGPRLRQALLSLRLV